MARSQNKNVFSDANESGMDVNFDNEIGMFPVLELREAGWRFNKDEPPGEPGP